MCYSPKVVNHCHRIKIDTFNILRLIILLYNGLL